MKIIYEQTYVAKVDITVIMKAIYRDDEIIEYYLCGYYFGEPSVDAFDIFKDTIKNKNCKNI